MQTLILTLHIIVCVVLVILILLQAGKEGMGVIFGGGNTSVFGSSGAGGMLAKMTAFMAVVFVVTSLSYTYVTSSRPSDESAVLKVEPLTIEDVPAKPAAAPEAAAPVQPAAASEAPAAPEAAPANAAAPAAPAANIFRFRYLYRIKGRPCLSRITAFVPVFLSNGRSFLKLLILIHISYSVPSGEAFIIRRSLSRAMVRTPGRKAPE